ncbi:MAG: tRNA-dihydrouridine synthase [Candidatus Magasanikbacteria bacterium]
MTLESSKFIIALAPMADMTDSPFVRVCREIAGDGFTAFREMVSSEAIVRDSQKTLHMCAFEESERPIVIQVFGGNVETIAHSSKIIVDKFHPDGIDVNMGCPVPKIAAKNLAGACLMKDHKRACDIVRSLKNSNLGVPVSVKTRLGWTKSDDILEFAPMLEQAGADMIAIHGRTKAQGYSGKADWEMIARAKKLIKIPVLANGDINSRSDIARCLEVTGADGVMIGRGALGNPWILSTCHSEYSEESPVLISEIMRVVLRHARFHVDHYGPNSMVTFRKHLLLYFKGIAGFKDFRLELAKVKSIDELEPILHRIK